MPYRGSAPALQGLLAGDVDLMFDNLGVSLPLVEAGKLKLLAVASRHAHCRACRTCRRSPKLLPGFEAVAWYGIVAPPNTPKAIIDKINADVNEALRQPEVQDQSEETVGGDFGGSVEKTAKYMQRGGRALGQRDQGRRHQAPVTPQTVIQAPLAPTDLNTASSAAAVCRMPSGEMGICSCPSAAFAK